jgi:hypothetical protein
MSRFDDGIHDGRGDRFFIPSPNIIEAPPSCDDWMWDDDEEEEEEATVFHESRIHFVLRQVPGVYLRDDDVAVDDTFQ